MRKILVFATVVAYLLMTGNAFAKLACDFGAYSEYIAGNGSIADNQAVMQGGCTYTFSSGWYLNGWVSQSLHNPGWDKTFGNELDGIAGWDGKIAEKWSIDVHGAYYDLANEKLLHGSNGDLAGIVNTIRYHVNDKLTTYSNVEFDFGLGSRGFSNGWKAGLGVQATVFDTVFVNGILYHNEFLGTGEFSKLTVESAKAIFKVVGGEVRPTVTWWQPIGNYTKNNDTHMVIGARFNW